MVAAGIVNRRPLTRFSDDPQDFCSLTPMDFLQPGAFIHSSNVVLPATPPSGSELRRSKDRLRHLLDALWKKWRTDYVMTLQQRSKWLGRRPNLRVNDLVLLTDESAPREFWPLAIVTEIKPDEVGNVRTIVVKSSGGKEHERDIRKVALLERDGEETVENVSKDTSVSSLAGAEEPQIDVDFLSDNVEPKRNLRPRKHLNYHYR